MKVVASASQAEGEERSQAQDMAIQGDRISSVTPKCGRAMSRNIPANGPLRIASQILPCDHAQASEESCARNNRVHCGRGLEQSRTAQHSHGNCPVQRPKNEKPAHGAR